MIRKHHDIVVAPAHLQQLQVEAVVVKLFHKRQLLLKLSSRMRCRIQPRMPLLPVPNTRQRRARRRDETITARRRHLNENIRALVNQLTNALKRNRVMLVQHELRVILVFQVTQRWWPVRQGSVLTTLMLRQ